MMEIHEALYGKDAEALLETEFESEEQQESAREFHRITTEQEANKYLWVIGRVSRQADELIDQYTRQFDKLKAWLIAESDKLERKRLWFESLLREWAHDELVRRGGKGKTLKLIEGELSFKKSSQPKAVFNSKEEVVAEIQSKLGDDTPLLKIEFSPKITEIRKAVDNGLELESISFVEQPDSFSVKVK